MNSQLSNFFQEVSLNLLDRKIRYDDRPFEGSTEIRLGFDRCFVDSGTDSPSGIEALALLKGLYEERLKEGIERFIAGLESDIEFPLPLSVISIQSSNYKDIQDLLYTLFESVFSYPMNGILNVFLPINDMESLEESVLALHDSIAEELYLKASMGTGILCTSREELRRSYQTSRIAMKLCDVLKKDVIFYHRQWLDRLVLYMPVDDKKEFIRENIKGIDILKDEETLKTINAFLSCNLSLSEASRLLYIHRNTLSYRLDKIQYETGLDIRNFEDAIKMKLCLTMLRSML